MRDSQSMQQIRTVVQHEAPIISVLRFNAGIELILGAADTCLVNLPVAWMAQRCFDLGIGLGLFGHLNLSLSIVTYILNTWLFADKMTTFDSYRILNGGAPNFCPTSSTRSLVARNHCLSLNFPLPFLDLPHCLSLTFPTACP